MRIVLCALALLAVSVGSVQADTASGPWGIALTNAQQTAAMTPMASPEQMEAFATRHLKPTIIRNQPYYCVPYARAISGIALRGNAWTWWGGAKGSYARGSAPEIGAVMVMQRIRSMRLGHVAMVSEIISPRLIRVDHANWVRGEVHRGALVKDVSPNNDWSRVRVWYPPRNDFGTTNYPIYGFIYPRAS